MLKLINLGNMRFLNFELDYTSSETVRNALNKNKVDLDERLKYFENSYTDSMQYLETNRDKCHLLNHFTTRQLISLRYLLAKFESNDIDDNHVNCLVQYLYVINSNISKNILKNAIDMTRSYYTRHERDVDDFFSVDRVCKLLTNLNDLNRDVFNRVIPNYLNHINLFVCSQNEMFRILLDVYLKTVDAPLPTNDELIFINKETTEEELKLFFKRINCANANCFKRIYSIVNLQLFSFDNLIELISKCEQVGIVLCLFYVSNKENTFVEKLEKYKVDLKKLKLDTTQQITSSLVRKFALSKSNTLSRCLVMSNMSGVGKSLYIRKSYEELKEKFDTQLSYHYVPIKDKSVSFGKLFNTFTQLSKSPKGAHFYHVDIAFEVGKGVDEFLFRLIFMNVLYQSNGNLWRPQSTDIFRIEIMSPYIEAGTYLHSICNLMPKFMCLSPLNLLNRGLLSQTNLCFTQIDKGFLQSEKVQMCCQYLQLSDFTEFKYENQVVFDSQTCLRIMFDAYQKYAPSNNNPSWSEIHYLFTLLYEQLKQIESNPYCEISEPEYKEFRNFIVKFIIKMCFDFGLPSMNLSGPVETTYNENTENLNLMIEKYNIKRKWNNNSHPYLFINEDRQTFTFLGFFIDKNNLIVDRQTNEVIQEYRSLKLPDTVRQLISQVDEFILSENVNNLEKSAMIAKLLKIMHDTVTTQNINDMEKIDPLYELTQDNLLKMIAIYTRLKYKIPVVIMGETGCGKTRLIEYMCRLQILNMNQKPMQTLYILRIHSGITVDDLVHHVTKAEELAMENRKLYPSIFTILLFDEANSTEAVGTIKEIMIDHTVNGKRIDLDYGLRFIATCNPYKKHSDEVIRRFEESSLGYFGHSHDQDHHLTGVETISMRDLVYRVQPLPESLLRIVFDFGTLSVESEKKYIEKIIKKKFLKEQDRDIDAFVSAIAKAQNYLKDKEHVITNLRDIRRVLIVFDWFRSIIDHIINNLDNKIYDSLILSLLFCYYTSILNMDNKKHFRQTIAECFNDPKIDEIYISNLTEKCQNGLLKSFKVPSGIALNHALKENIFMLIICIQLKIPLFIIGKPGSSKSLSKTLIDNYFNDSGFDLLKTYLKIKQVSLITYQCSPLSTSESIINTFQHAAKEQLRRLLQTESKNNFSSVVVLDEIGLAEASTSMPLKSLHELLENGVPFSKEAKKLLVEKNNRDLNNNLKSLINESYDEWQKVALVATSNWCLDPAKISRGICVNRTNPSMEELIETIEGIFRNKGQLDKIKKYVNEIIASYLRICVAAKEQREFFGLRDFYCMARHIDKKLNSLKLLDKRVLEEAVVKNFDGAEINGKRLEPLTYFKETYNQLTGADANINELDLIKDSYLTSNDSSRYLLLITETDNYNFLIDSIRHNLVESTGSAIAVIYGSRFPKDQEYSEIRRNIRKIKMHMRCGSTIILIDTQRIYESLYDVFNKFYSKFGREDKIVDIGLGNVREKCIVHPDFRIIIIAAKNKVYDPQLYPIPLLNRLEKHFYYLPSILNKKQIDVFESIKRWCRELQQKSSAISQIRDLSDFFVGYSDDLLASHILILMNEIKIEGQLEEN